MRLRSTREVSLEESWIKDARQLTDAQLHARLARLDDLLSSMPSWAFGSNIDSYRRVERRVIEDELASRQP